MGVNLDQLYEEIKSDEGLVTNDEGESLIYKCTEGYLTCGIGHKIVEGDAEYGFVEGDTVPMDSVKQHFEKDVQTAIEDCRAIYGDGFDSWSEERCHIVVNMAFQLGRKGLSSFKKFNAYFQEGAYGGASLEMMDSKWALHQTPNRAKRLSERVLALANDPSR